MMSNYTDFAFYYDILTQNISYKKRGQYFHNIICNNSDLKNDKILLDLGCGTGSLSFIMEELGYNVIGVDNSTTMLNCALDKKIDRNSDILFLCQDMTELDLYGTINVAICALDTLNHVLDFNDLQKIFDRVYLFLESGGLFIFDVNTIYKHQEVLKDNTFVIEDESVYCVWQNSLINEDTVQIHLDLFEYDDKANAYKRYIEEFCERAYSIERIESIIKKSKFSIVGVYDDDTNNPYHEKTQRLVYVIKK